MPIRTEVNYVWLLHLVHKMKINDKRDSPEDRRHDMDTPKTPFNDKNGIAVIRDRRIAPDRRINNIEVEWIEEGEINRKDDSERTA